MRAPTPENLTAQAGGANQVSLTWTSSGSGLVFDVYRAPGGCAGWLDYVKVGETTSTSFLDSSASGGVTYAYAVTAREALGACVSRLSDCVEATTSGGCLEAPGFAGVTSVTDPHAQTCTLSVAWSPATASSC